MDADGGHAQIQARHKGKAVLGGQSQNGQVSCHMINILYFFITHGHTKMICLGRPSAKNCTIFIAL